MADDNTKSRVKLARNQHDVHVGLLMMHQGLSKADALVMAYLDGFTGFSARLAPTPAKPEATK